MPAPYEIVCVVHSLAMGGLENGVVNLLNRLPRDLYRFTVLAIRPVWTLRDRIERDDVAFHSVGKRWGNDPLLPLRMLQILRSIRPALVHTRNWSTIEGIAAARLAGVSAVVHGEHGLNSDEAYAMKARRLTARRVFYRMADRVVTVSDTLRDTLAAGIRSARDKILTIRNGVDTDRFRSNRSAARARLSLGLPRDGVLIGSAGRLDPVKDYATLLRAFERVAARFPGARLAILGEGRERSSLESLAVKLGIGDAVFFPGARDDMESLYPAFDIFTLPSLTEGMSNTLLEAMATGLPIVATRVGGNVELVVDGENGFLAPPGNADQLALSIQTMIEDPLLREEMGRASRRRAERLFSLDRMVRSYDSLYRSLVGHEAPVPIPR